MDGEIFARKDEIKGRGWKLYKEMKSFRMDARVSGLIWSCRSERGPKKKPGDGTTARLDWKLGAQLDSCWRRRWIQLGQG